MLNPDMPTAELLLHMGELAEQEVRTARAAIRWANAEMNSLRAALERITGRTEPARLSEILSDQPKVLAAKDGWANPGDLPDSFNADRDQLGPSAVPVTAIFVERVANE